MAESPFSGTDYQRRMERYLRLQITPDEARMTVYSACQREGHPVTAEEALARLAQLNVVHGVDKAAVREITERKLYDREIAVARATRPVNGRDASVEEKVKVDFTHRPVEAAGVRTNLREMENLTQVREGQVLALKVPATAGADGTDVFGNPIKANPGLDLVLAAGENVKVSPDGNSLVSAKSGYVYRGKTGLSVGDVFAVKGDVDFSVGNLHYRGDVVIDKDVRPDFTVRAEKDVTVQGQAEACLLVSEKGSVLVRGGVFGMGKGKIEAAKAIESPIVQDADLSAGKSVRIAKVAMGARVFGAEAVECRDAVGGIFTSYKLLDLVNCGNASGIRTLLCLTDQERENLKKKKEQIGHLIEDLTARTRQIEIRLKGVNKALAHGRGAAPAPELLDQIRHGLLDLNLCRKKIGFLEGHGAKLDEQAKVRTDFPGRIRVTGACRAGTVVRILDHELEIREDIYKKEFRLEKGVIQINDVQAGGGKA